MSGPERYREAEWFLGMARDWFAEERARPQSEELQAAGVAAAIGIGHAILSVAAALGFVEEPVLPPDSAS